MGFMTIDGNRVEFTDEPNILAVIRKMAELRDQGIITSSEFEKKKRELLKRL